jgi:hypothetical protein
MAQIRIDGIYEEDTVYLNGSINPLRLETRPREVYKNGKLVSYTTNAETRAFVSRVKADGGTVEDVSYLDQFISDAKRNGYYNDIVAAYSPSWGVKGTTTASKLYSVIGAGQDMEQTTGSKQPSITLNAQNGRTILTFDGVDDFFTKSFVFNLPATVIMMGMRQITWTANDFISDGQGAITGGIKQITATPSITQQVAADVGGTPNNDLAVNTAAHLRALFNQPTSAILQIDNNAEVDTGVTTVSNLNGFSLGGKFNDTLWANISVGAVVLLMPAVDGTLAAKMSAIYNFSKQAYGTP